MSPERQKQVWPVDVVEYSRGMMVVREGEEADCAFLIQSGEVEVLKKSHAGRDVRIAKLGAQELFGELCLFEEAAIRSASVRVITDVAVVMIISKANFQSQLADTPEVIRNIMTILTRRLRQASQQIALLS